MNVTMHRKPCLLLEAVELVFAYVNGISEKKLTGKGPYCIPAPEVRQIMDTACAALPNDPETVQFYFRKMPIMGEEQFSCLARCLVYVGLYVHCHDVVQTVQQLQNKWESRQRPLCITGITPYSVTFETCKTEGFTFLSKEMGKLPVSKEFQLQLAEVFTGYDFYLNQLAILLQPVVDALEPLLVPWVERAQPLIDQWEAMFQSDEAEQFFTQRAQIDSDQYGSLYLAMRYFNADSGYMRIYDDDQPIQMLLGVGMNVGPKKQEEGTLEDWEYAALRLLANPDRIAMLNAMTERSMSGQELMEQLGLRSGSVFRDLNNMYTYRLLIKEVGSNRNTYRTNIAVIEELTARVLRSIKTKPQK